MTHDKIDWLFKNDITVRLVRADHAPLIISFIYRTFKQQSRIAYPEKELDSLLGDHLHVLNQPEVLYSLSAKQYLLKWTEQGFFRRYYEQGDDPVFDLTPAAENAVKWMEDLSKQEFVGTESRLLHFFSILKELTLKTNTNLHERIKDLEDQKKKLEAEIQKAKHGSIEVFDETRIKERYLYAEETAKRLLADFRQVEQNFRDLDKGVRERIIKSNVPKGKLLDDIFSEQDYVWTTDQGKSFKAFWEFLMSRQKQDELDNLIKYILSIPVVMKLREETIIHRIKNNLIEAGDKVNRTNDGLIEQLRKFVEQKSLLESKRILHSIEEIEKLLLEGKENKFLHDRYFDLAGIFKGHFFMSRLPFTPPYNVTFETAPAEIGVSEAIDDALFDQFTIDQQELRDNINNLLRHQSQVTLKDVTEKFNITRGVAEVVAYYHIASKENKHFINTQQEEQVVVQNSRSGKTFNMRLPQVIFNR